MKIKIDWVKLYKAFEIGIAIINWPNMKFGITIYLGFFALSIAI